MNPIQLLRQTSGRVKNALIRVGNSFWLLPILLVTTAIGLALLTVELDHQYFADIQENPFWLFGGHPSAARSLLSTIASALITVVAVAFSITLVAIQQAATQYSPRVLRRFTNDRANQWVLGTYLGTFTYALLTLRDVRSSTENTSGFVPALSVTVAMGLTLISVGLLVYFIHHITRALQVSTILTSVRSEFDEQLDHLYPDELTSDEEDPPTYAEEISRALPDPEKASLHLRSTREGHLRHVNVKELLRICKKFAPEVIWVRSAVGDYVARKAPLVSIWSDRPLDRETEKQLQNALDIHSDRTMYQDPLYGIRQIVDIALKAISPGVNDPTTAEQCIDQLKGAVTELVNRKLPAARTEHEGTTLIINRPDLSSFIDLAYDQIWRGAPGSGSVAIHLIRSLRDIVPLCSTEARRKVVLTKILNFAGEIDELDFKPMIRESLIREFRAALDPKRPTRAGLSLPKSPKEEKRSPEGSANTPTTH